jgi:hypothetical protein
MGVGVGVGGSVGMGVDGAGVKVARGVTVANDTGSVGGGDVGVGRVICGPQPSSRVAISRNVSSNVISFNIGRRIIGGIKNRKPALLSCPCVSPDQPLDRWLAILHGCPNRR